MGVMSLTEKPARILKCRMCGRVRLAGRRGGWMEEAELAKKYKRDTRFKQGRVVYDNEQYCDIHSSDLHVEEEFPSDDATGE